MSYMSDKAIEAMNEGTNLRDNAFQNLREALKEARQEGTDLPLSTIGVLVATEACADQWEARAVIKAIQIEWEV